MVTWTASKSTKTLIRERGHSYSRGEHLRSQPHGALGGPGVRLGKTDG